MEDENMKHLLKSANGLLKDISSGGPLFSAVHALKMRYTNNKFLKKYPQHQSDSQYIRKRFTRSTNWQPRSRPRSPTGNQ